MKVSLSWIEGLNEQYGCAADPAPKGIEDLVERIGRQLGAIESVENLGEKYRGIIAAKVIKCDKHPNADKLSTCMIDAGKAKPVQVVCGAPNVAAGQMVIWIPPGATVPSTYDKEPFVLEAKELRGVVSHGMIASAQELAIGDDHNGIVVLDNKVKPGQSFAELYRLNDYIIDVENKMLTHRPDLFGILGMAREIAGIQGQVFKSPNWYKEDASLPKPRGDGLKLTVKNELPKAVPRFTVVAIRDVKVGPSPLWLQTKLARVGLRSINNIVDLTNFMMYETGQPTHAYDYDKVGDQLLVRTPMPGETIKLLNGKIVKLLSKDVVIASKDQAIGLGGVMGGEATEVSDTTTNIILECANFDMTAVRQSAMAHGLQTDAVTRFTKGQSPRQNLAVLVELANKILKPELSGGRLASQVIDIKSPAIGKSASIKTSGQFINSRLGLELSTTEIAKLLKNVEFSVSVTGDKLQITVPFWRTDVEIPEDIVEEVGRLYGYDKLKLELPARDLTPPDRDSLMDLKSRIRQILASAGTNEVQTYSFVPGSLLEKVGQDSKNSYHIRNAISPELQYYRQTLSPGLLAKVNPSLKAGYDEFALFEIGKSYFKGVVDKQKLPLELEQLALVLASKNGQDGAAYFQAQAICRFMLEELGFSNVRFEVPAKKTLHPALSYFEFDRSANVFADGQMIGRLGEYTASVRQRLKLPDYTAGFELYLSAIQPPQVPFYEPLNRFPGLDQDITLRVPSNVSYGELYKLVKDSIVSLAAAHGSLVWIMPLDIYQKNPEHKQFSWRITLLNRERTLTTEEANNLLDKLAGSAKKLKADRI